MVTSSLQAKIDQVQAAKNTRLQNSKFVVGGLILRNRRSWTPGARRMRVHALDRMTSLQAVLFAHDFITWLQGSFGLVAESPASFNARLMAIRYVIDPKGVPEIEIQGAINLASADIHDIALKTDQDQRAYPHGHPTRNYFQENACALRNYFQENACAFAIARMSRDLLVCVPSTVYDLSKDVGDLISAAYDLLTRFPESKMSRHKFEGVLHTLYTQAMQHIDDADGNASWLNSQAIGMAQRIAATGDRSILTILADNLDENGFPHEEITCQFRHGHTGVGISHAVIVRLVGKEHYAHIECITACR